MQAALAIQEESQERAERTSEIRVAANPVETAACSVVVQLPMRLSHKWVAYACRTAGVGKPRWHRTRGVWTCTAVDESGITETLTITASSDAMSVRIVAESADSEGPSSETATARRLATAFVTSMRDGLRRRSVISQAYADLNRVAALRSSLLQQARP